MFSDSILLFSGVTFVYAGILLSSQNGLAALCFVAIGIVLSIRPLAHIYRLLSESTVSGKTGQDRRKRPGRSRKRNTHLNIVDPDNKEPPTYH